MFDADFSPLVFVASGFNTLLREFRLTNTYIRFALLVTAPMLFAVSLVSLYSSCFNARPKHT